MHGEQNDKVDDEVIDDFHIFINNNDNFMRVEGVQNMRYEPDGTRKHSIVRCEKGYWQRLSSEKPLETLVFPQFST